MIPRLLHEGEVIRFRSRRHILALLVPLGLIALAGVLTASRACPVAFGFGLDGTCLSLVALGVAIAALVFAFDWLTTEFVLTNERLLLVQAPVWLRTRAVELVAILELRLKIGIFGRLFGFGDVIVVTAVTEGGQLTLGLVPAPETWARRIAAAVADREELT